MSAPQPIAACHAQHVDPGIVICSSWNRLLIERDLRQPGSSGDSTAIAAGCNAGRVNIAVPSSHPGALYKRIPAHLNQLTRRTVGEQVDSSVTVLSSNAAVTKAVF
jgi:hypothetical protein